MYLCVFVVGMGMNGFVLYIYIDTLDRLLSTYVQLLWSILRYIDLCRRHILMDNMRADTKFIPEHDTLIG